jgi:hypothetical protein
VAEAGDSAPEAEGEAAGTVLGVLLLLGVAAQDEPANDLLIDGERTRHDFLFRGGPLYWLGPEVVVWVVVVEVASGATGERGDAVVVDSSVVVVVVDEAGMESSLLAQPASAKSAAAADARIKVFMEG